MTEKPKVGINATARNWYRVFPADVRGRLSEILHFPEIAVTESRDPSVVRKRLVGARVILSTWGAIPLTADLLDVCPRLELVVHAAGSVKPLLTPEFKSRGIKICSASHVNAQPVAEFVLGIILVSAKRILCLREEVQTGKSGAWTSVREALSDNYRAPRVGLVGFGEVTRHLCKLLAQFEFKLFISSSHLDYAQAAKLGVNLSTLDEILSTCDIISLHGADSPRNRFLIDKTRLRELSDYATLINTSRGALIDETALVEELRRRPIRAYIDVTLNEPPPPEHPFYSLPNCILTPHIAGSMGEEMHRMAEYAEREVGNWLSGSPLEHQLNIDLIDSFA